MEPARKRRPHQTSHREREAEAEARVVEEEEREEWLRKKDPYYHFPVEIDPDAVKKREGARQAEKAKRLAELGPYQKQDLIRRMMRDCGLSSAVNRGARISQAESIGKSP